MEIKKTLKIDKTWVANDLCYYNKQKCLDKCKLIEKNPSQRKRGRRRNNVEEGHTSTTISHHEMTVQPSTLGKSNKPMKTRKGSKRGTTSAEVCGNLLSFH